MPELPEVEQLRRSLMGPLLGRTIVDASLHRRDVAVMPGDPPGGFGRSRDGDRPKRITRRDLLLDAKVHTLARKGKQLAIVASDGRAICVHLGMTGAILHAPFGSRLEDPRHVHATWRLDDGSRFVFRDARRFGGLWVCPTPEDLAAKWNGLGPDALGARTSEFLSAFRQRAAPVKAVLLDQRAVSGIGNIYADEALFRARVRPTRPAMSLSKDETWGLASSVRTILRQAVGAGGSTIRSYTDAQGRSGRQQVRHVVYGRAGLPCQCCGQGLVRSVVAQRTTVSCLGCQR